MVRKSNQIEVRIHKVAGETVYVMAVMDIFFRRILKWQISNTINATVFIDILFCHGIG